MNPNYATNFDTYKQLGIKKLNERADKIKNNDEFGKKVSAILQEEAQEKKDLDSQLDIQAEESIYSGGFPDDKTKMALKEFQKAEWKDRLVIADKMKDERYNYFAKRLMYEEAPDLLPKDLYDEIHRGIAKRILSTNDEKWNTIPRTYKEIDDLRAKFEKSKETDKLKMLEEINAYVEELEKVYSRA